MCVGLWQPALQMLGLVIVWRHMNRLKETFLFPAPGWDLLLSALEETITGEDLLSWLSWALKGLHEYVKISRKLLKQKKKKKFSP